MPMTTLLRENHQIHHLSATCFQEATLEAVLDEHGIFYNKTEVWIESEKLYEVLYTFEMEV